eukprot:Nk52_evm3s310 gene=Nk52_evmTU3s310
MSANVTCPVVDSLGGACTLSGFNCGTLQNCTFQDTINATNTITIKKQVIDYCSGQGVDYGYFGSFTTLNNLTYTSEENETVAYDQVVQLAHPLSCTMNADVEECTLGGVAMVSTTNAFTFYISTTSSGIYQELFSFTGIAEPECNFCGQNNGGCWVNGSIQATCTAGNEAGQRTCQCPADYEGTGVGSKGCVLTNPCNTDNGGCDPKHGICTFSEADHSRTCTCETGYSLDPSTNQCSSIDPCKSVSYGGCASVNHGGNCTYTGPGTNTCSCQEGYKLNSTDNTCSAIDKCATGESNCSNNAMCTMTGPGTFRCTCNVEYEGDGITCTPIPSGSPCSGKSPCSQSEVCKVDGPNSYICVPSESSSGSGGLSTVWIVVIAILASCVFVLAVVLMILFCRKYKKERQQLKELKEDMPPLSAKRKPITESASLGNSNGVIDIVSIDPVNTELGLREKRTSYATSMAYDLPYDNTKILDFDIESSRSFKPSNLAQYVSPSSMVSGVGKSENISPSASEDMSGNRSNRRQSKETYYTNIYTAKVGSLMSSGNSSVERSKSSNDEFFSDINSQYEEAYLYPDISALRNQRP